MSAARVAPPHPRAVGHPRSLLHPTRVGDLVSQPAGLCWPVACRTHLEQADVVVHRAGVVVRVGDGLGYAEDLLGPLGLLQPVGAQHHAHRGIAPVAQES